MVAMLHASFCALRHKAFVASQVFALEAVVESQSSLPLGTGFEEWYENLPRSSRAPCEEEASRLRVAQGWANYGELT